MPPDKKRSEIIQVPVNDVERRIIQRMSAIDRESMAAAVRTCVMERARKLGIKIPDAD